jgi:hypothetical protein
MSRSLLSFSLVALLLAGARADEPRKPHPNAPSLPELTEEEEKKLDVIIDRFMLYDIGKLRGTEGQQAYRDFVKLKPEAIPALLRGLNRAAAMNHSCPVTVIATKLGQLLAASTDVKLMDFARDEMISAASDGQHKAIVQNLRFATTQRMNALKAAGITGLTSGQKQPRLMSTAALIEEAGKEKSGRLRSLLFELGQRNGDEVLNTLGVFAGDYNKETQKTARTALITNLTRQKPEELKKSLTNEKSEVRLAAVRVIRNRDMRWGSELIDRLSDDDPNVREWAQTTLVRLARGLDYGPAKNATKAQSEQSIQRWRAWWANQNPGTAVKSPGSGSKSQ